MGDRCLFIAYLLVKVYVKRAQKKVAERLPENAKRYTATFTFSKRRDFSYWFGIGLVAIFVFLFMRSNNGSEGILLIPITILSWYFFIVWLGMTPIHYDYEKQYISLVSIEEKK